MEKICLQTKLHEAGVNIQKLSTESIETAEKVLLEYGGGQNFTLHHGDVYNWINRNSFYDDSIWNCVYKTSFYNGSIWVSEEDNTFKLLDFFKSHDAMAIELAKRFLLNAEDWDAVLKSETLYYVLLYFAKDLDKNLLSMKNILYNWAGDDTVEALKQIAICGNRLLESTAGTEDYIEGIFDSLLHRLSGIGAVIDIKQSSVYGENIELDKSCGALFYSYKKDKGREKFSCTPNLFHEFQNSWDDKPVKRAEYIKNRLTLSKRVESLRSIVGSIIKTYLIESVNPRSNETSSEDRDGMW